MTTAHCFGAVGGIRPQALSPWAVDGNGRLPGFTQPTSQHRLFCVGDNLRLAFAELDALDRRARRALRLRTLTALGAVLKQVMLLREDAALMNFEVRLFIRYQRGQTTDAGAEVLGVCQRQSGDWDLARSINPLFWACFISF